jgi:hypothetical protein
MSPLPVWTTWPSSRDGAVETLHIFITIICTIVFADMPLQ